MEVITLNRFYERVVLERMHSLWSLVYKLHTSIPAPLLLRRFLRRLLLLKLDSCPSIQYHVTWEAAFRDVSRLAHAALSANSFEKLTGVQSAVYLLPVLFVLFAILFLTAPRFRSGRCVPSSTKSLQALSSVLIPARSPWPSDYALLLTHTTHPRSRSISISISNLIDSVCTGAVELKDPEDLTLLVGQELRVYGWRCSIKTDLPLLKRVMHRIVLSRLPSIKHELLPHGECMQHSGNSTYTGRFGTDVQLPVLVIDIDFVPHGCLQSAIAASLSALESNTRLVVNVTTVALGTPLLSHKFLLCSLPFLPRQYLKAGSGASPCRRLGSLLTPLHRIIELISQHQVTVKAVENVSKAREKELWALEQQLVNDRALRTSTTGNYGIEGWREHRFLTAWEAALLSNGHLVRWSVIICK